MNYFKKLCPSGRGKNKLRGIQFTADQRQWMGVAMIARQFTPSIASLTFNLKAPSIRQLFDGAVFVTYNQYTPIVVNYNPCCAKCFFDHLVRTIEKFYVFKQEKYLFKYTAI